MNLKNDSNQKSSTTEEQKKYKVQTTKRMHKAIKQLNIKLIYHHLHTPTFNYKKFNMSTKKLQQKCNAILY